MSGDEKGRLLLIRGPMFAGKTTALIDRLGAARNTGATAVAVKPALDTRYDATRIVTHENRAVDAVTVSDAAGLESAATGAEVVGIDEAHFFEAPFATACRALADRGACVIVAGVDLDHVGKPFPVMARLAELADEVITLAARCARCGGVARFTQRLIDSDARIAVGGVGDYEPRCDACFERGDANRGLTDHG